jgi:hypothetical protein
VPLPSLIEWEWSWVMPDFLTEVVPFPVLRPELVGCFFTPGASLATNFWPYEVLFLALYFLSAVVPLMELLDLDASLLPA